MNGQDALALIFARNAFYKRLHYLAFAAFILSIVIIGFLCSIIIFLLRNPTAPVYFAADNVGRLIRVVPTTMPNMTTDELLAWTTDAVEAAYSYDYINYHGQLQAAQKYFTNYGWTKYMSALSSSNNLVALTQRKMVAVANVVGQPKILLQGLVGGSLAWKMEVPVLVTYSWPPYDDNSKFSNALQVNLIVQRQPVLQSYRGLGIAQMVGAFATTMPPQLQPIASTPTEE